jgi:hypothetical protein
MDVIEIMTVRIVPEVVSTNLNGGGKMEGGMW